nr:hypothetical protein [Tanacetum cinerariifolium]
MNSSDPNPSKRPTKVEVPKELPKVSMEQGLIIAALRDELRKLKGKDIVGVKPSTSANGSQPSGNTKKDKIQRPLSST